MIRSLSANQASFQTVVFTPGFNVVLADRAANSSDLDSRNGLGKSTLLEIIHFCLGGDPDNRRGSIWPRLSDWTFSLEVELSGRVITARRSIVSQNWVEIVGQVDGLPIQPEALGPGARPRQLSVTEWKDVLGYFWFGLPIGEITPKPPSFRQLFSYVARRGQDSILSPFSYTSRQPEAERQKCVAFLLGLGWEYAAQLNEILSKRKEVADVKKAVAAGVLRGWSRNPAELEAQRVQLQAQVDEQERQLRTFKVHERYREIEREASALTERLNKLANRRYSLVRLQEMYRRGQADETSAEDLDVATLFAEANIALPELVTKRIEDVRVFHQTVIHNRRAFLEAEIIRLSGEIRAFDQDIRTLDSERAAKLLVLSTHKALEQYTLLHDELSVVRGRLEEVKSLIAERKHLRTFDDALRLELAQIRQSGRLDLEDRSAARSKAIALFNLNSQALYERPGKLLIGFENNGYQFGVEIERAGSDGIEQMKVFCFDLMLAQLWAERSPAGHMLFHDSRLFDGVDERQRARALRLAAAESERLGFQYICTLNSDQIPVPELEGFSLEPYTRLRLTDDSPAGSLLGMRF